MTISDHYADIVRAQNRVVLQPSVGTRLPLDLSLRVAARVKWLREACLPRLDRELEVTFPVVVVEQRLWKRTLPSGEVTSVIASALPIKFGDIVVFGVRFSAVTLLAYPNEVIEGLLVHEFLHYVWMTTSDNPLELTQHDAGTADFAHVLATDPLSQADPEVWLSERLHAAVQHADRRDEDSLVREWMRKWKPTLRDREEVDWKIRIRGELVLDGALLRRHQILVPKTLRTGGRRNPSTEDPPT